MPNDLKKASEPSPEPRAAKSSPTERVLGEQHIREATRTGGVDVGARHGDRAAAVASLTRSEVDVLVSQIGTTVHPRATRASVFRR